MKPSLTIYTVSDDRIARKLLKRAMDKFSHGDFDDFWHDVKRELTSYCEILDTIGIRITCEDILQLTRERPFIWHEYETHFEDLR